MSNHEPGFTLTAKALAYLKCHPFTDARKCGACHRSQGACFRAPCPTRLDATEA
jgi:hypothetical protein